MADINPVRHWQKNPKTKQGIKILAALVKLPSKTEESIIRLFLYQYINLRFLQIR